MRREPERSFNFSHKFRVRIVEESDNTALHSRKGILIGDGKKWNYDERNAKEEKTGDEKYTGRERENDDKGYNIDKNVKR